MAASAVMSVDEMCPPKKRLKKYDTKGDALQINHNRANGRMCHISVKEKSSKAIERDAIAGP